MPCLKLTFGLFAALSLAAADSDILILRLRDTSSYSKASNFENGNPREVEYCMRTRHNTTSLRGAVYLCARNHSQADVTPHTSKGSKRLAARGKFDGVFDVTRRSEGENCELDLLSEDVLRSQETEARPASPLHGHGDENCVHKETKRAAIIKWSQAGRVVCYTDFAPVLMLSPALPTAAAGIRDLHRVKVAVVEDIAGPKQPVRLREAKHCQTPAEQKDL
ncbi:hypothetical protein BaRGS_00012985, partial [Batillaria attramentaria]